MQIHGAGFQIDGAERPNDKRGAFRIRQIAGDKGEQAVLQRRGQMGLHCGHLHGTEHETALGIQHA